MHSDSEHPFSHACTGVIQERNEVLLFQESGHPAQYEPDRGGKMLLSIANLLGSGMHRHGQSLTRTVPTVMCFMGLVLVQYE